jgi:hypothetical protein
MKTKPIISQDFTIDDIHKIREWHYEQRKEMGMEEYTTNSRRIRLYAGKTLCILFEKNQYL